MSLRTGIQLLYQNARSWGIKSGTNLRDYFNKGQEIARHVQPHLEEGVQFAETVNEHVQRNLTPAQHKQRVASWTANLRKFTNDYNIALNTADLVHDVLLAPG